MADALGRNGAGGYVGFLGDEDEETLRAAYPNGNWERLRGLKRRYDPDNLFRLNHNIPPAEGSEADLERRAQSRSHRLRLPTRPMDQARSNSNLTIAVACLAASMLMLDISVVNTALSDIADGLDTGLSGLQWVVDAYTIPLAATVLTAGAIADRFGRRRLFALGLGLFTAMSALCGAAGGIEVLVGSRALQGLGASMMFATALALISKVTPKPEDRVKALAAYGAAIGASFALGPFVGGSLTELFGWRAIFLINVPIGAVALWITYRFVAEGKDPARRSTSRVSSPSSAGCSSWCSRCCAATRKGGGAPGSLRPWRARPPS